MRPPLATVAANYSTYSVRMLDVVPPQRRHEATTPLLWAIAAVAKTIAPTTTREDTFGDIQRLRPGDVITNASQLTSGSHPKPSNARAPPTQAYANIKLTKYRHTIHNDLLPECISFRVAICTQEG